MSYTETTNKLYKKPAVGTPPADWPGYITDDLDAIDADIHALEVAGQEVIGARGGEVSLDARLDAIDAAVATGTAGAAEVVAARGGEASLDDRLDGLDTDIAAANAATAEVTAARGSKASLDARLDIALNEDGTLKADAYAEVATARGTKSSLNDRMSVSLNEDGTLKAEATVNMSAWSLPSFTFIYLTSATFKVVGDQTDIYKATRRLKATLNAGAVYSEVVSAAYAASYTTVTIANAVLDNTLTTIEHSILLPATDAADGGKSALSPRMLGQSATNYAADSGYANAYAVTLNPAPTAYFTGMKVSFLAAHANTKACTINVNGLGVTAIKKQATVDLQGNDIVAGQVVEVVYDGTSFQLVSVGHVKQDPRIAATLAAVAVNTWNTRSSAADNSWNGICWSPELGLFVAVGSGGTYMTSPNGVTWTLRTDIAYRQMNAIAWSAELGLFAAVADNGSVDMVTTSPDGVTWSIRTTAIDHVWKSIAWSPALGMFAAVGSATGSSGARCMTSTNGTTWTLQSTPGTLSWSAIAWSPELGIFCAVGANDNVMTSINGSTWVQRTGQTGYTWTALAWSPELGMFVAVSESSKVQTSTDGITWTLRDAAASKTWRSIAWSPTLGIFVAVATEGDIMTSFDGITWTSRTTAAANSWNGIAWSPELGIFVAVASSGTGNRVMTSADRFSKTINPTLRAMVAGSSATTTGQALVDVTGLSVRLEANAIYEFEAMLSCTVSAVTTGTKYGVQFSAAGASVEGGIIGKAATGVGNDRVSALNTAYGPYLTEASLGGPILMKGIVTTGANAGNLTIQHLKVTSGTSTVYVGSFLKAIKIG